MNLYLVTVVLALAVLFSVIIFFTKDENVFVNKKTKEYSKGFGIGEVDAGDVVSPNINMNLGDSGQICFGGESCFERESTNYVNSLITRISQPPEPDDSQISFDVGQRVKKCTDIYSDNSEICSEQGLGDNWSEDQKNNAISIGPFIWGGYTEPIMCGPNQYVCGLTTSSNIGRGGGHKKEDNAITGVKMFCCDHAVSSP